MVVRRKNEQVVLVRVPGQVERHGGDGGCGVAAGRLQHDRLRTDADFAQLFGNHEAMALVANHHRRGEIGHALQAVERALDHAVMAGQLQKLLGVQLPGQGPQPGAGPAGENDRHDHIDSFGFSGRPVEEGQNEQPAPPGPIRFGSAGCSAWCCAASFATATQLAVFNIETIQKAIRRQPGGTAGKKTLTYSSETAGAALTRRAAFDPAARAADRCSK